MSKKLPGGVWPAVLTCLNENRQPCEKNITKIVELFIQQKCGGLYVLGSTGQGPALDMATRKKVMEITSKANKGRLPIMLHVGAVSPFEAIELAKHGQQNGADAISAVPPIYFHANADVMFAHYNTIASATNLPFYPYHFNTASLPPLKDYVRRILEIPNVQGMKVTEMNLFITEMIVAYAQGKLNIYSGADELNFSAIPAGADGCIGSFYNMYAPATIKAREAFLAGDIAAGRKFMVTFGRVILEIISDYALVYPFFRASMKLLHGVDIGPSATASAFTNKTVTEDQVRAWTDEVNAAAGL